MNMLEAAITKYEQLFNDPAWADAQSNQLCCRKEYLKRKQQEDRATKDRNFSLLFKKNMTANIFCLYFNPSM